MADTPPDRDVVEETLKAMARQDAGRGASPGVEAHLQRHVRTRKRARRATRLIGVAAAASLLVAAGLVHFRIERSKPLDQESFVVVIAPNGDGFLPLPNAHVPTADAHVVRMPVARAALASFGLDPSGLSVPDIVMADVLVGHDGIARFVRFIGLETNQELLTR
jgi:hypothetical protein